MSIFRTVFTTGSTLLILAVLAGEASSRPGILRGRRCKCPPAFEQTDPAGKDKTDGTGKFFLGLPDDAQRRIEDVEVHYPNRGFVTMTKVTETDYTAYLTAKRQGKITAEEHRGDVVYFATLYSRNEQLDAVGAGWAPIVKVETTQRYKAKIPPGKE